MPFNKMSVTLDVSEEYYKRIWSSDEWGQTDINEDEKLRGSVIRKLVEGFVLPEFRRQEELRILDVGCGRGWLTNMLATYGNCVGIDPVLSAVVRARELFPTREFKLADPRTLLSDIGTGRFDLVVASEVIEHVIDSEKEGFLRSIHSLLAPNGFAILTTPRGELWNAWKRLGIEEQPVEQWLTEKSLEELSRSVNFRIIARDRVFLPGFSKDRLNRVFSSRLLPRAMRFFPQSGLFARMKYHYGLYQVILLKRL